MMASKGKEVLEVLLTLDNELSKGLKEVITDMKGLEKTTKEQSTTFKDSFVEMKAKIDIAKEAYQTFAQTVTTIMDWGEQGAQVIQTGESFDFLLKKIGAAPDLLDQLRTASRGTIDDMSLMSSTATLLAGANGELATSLANATPELLEIAKAAQKLNPALGDTEFLYNSLATGIKRASPMILDNLGLTIKIGDANQKYADSLGKTVDQLTAEEQKQALLNATLEAGQVLIEQAGGTTDSATDSFAQLDAAVKNLTDQIKTGLAPWIIRAADAMTKLITANQVITETLSDHENMVFTTTESYDDYIAEVTRAAEAANYHVNANGDLVTSYGKVVEQGYAFSEAEWEQQRAVLAADEAAKFWLADAEAMPGAMNGVVNAEPNFSDAFKNMEENLRNVDFLMQSYNDKLLFNIASAGMTAEQQLALAEAMGLVNGNTQYAATKIAEFDLLLANEKITVEEYNQKVLELQQYMGMLEDRDITVRVHMEVDRDLHQFINSGLASVGSTGEGLPQLEAAGGPAIGSRPIIVGEAGPEVFIPSVSGTILPNSSVTNNFNLGVYTSQSNETVSRSFGMMQAANR